MINKKITVKRLIIKKMTIKEWLSSHPLININALEKQAGLWQGLLNHYMNNKRNLSKIQEKKVIKVLNKYGYGK